jgi:hypothetical protein
MENNDDSICFLYIWLKKAPKSPEKSWKIPEKSWKIPEKSWKIPPNVDNFSEKSWKIAHFLVNEKLMKKTIHTLVHIVYNAIFNMFCSIRASFELCY